MNSIIKYAMEKAANYRVVYKKLSDAAQWAANNRKLVQDFDNYMSANKPLGSHIKTLMTSGDELSKAQGKAMIRYGQQHGGKALDDLLASVGAEKGISQPQFWSKVGLSGKGLYGNVDEAGKLLPIKFRPFTEGVTDGKQITSIPSWMQSSKRRAATAAAPSPAGVATSSPSGGSGLGNFLAGAGQFTGDAMTSGARGAYNLGRVAAPYAASAGLGFGGGMAGSAYMNKKSSVIPTVVQAARKAAPVAGKALSFSAKDPLHMQHAALAQAVKAGHIDQNVLKMWQRGIPQGANASQSLGKPVSGIKTTQG